MRKASMIGGLAALVCLGISVLILVSAYDRAVVAGTDRISKAAERAVVLAKADRLPAVVPAEGATAIQVLDAHRQVVAATRQLTGNAPMAPFPAEKDTLRAVHELCPPAGLRGCMTVVSIRFSKADGPWVAYAAGPAPAVYGSAALLWSLAGVTVLVASLAAAGTYRSVHRVLAPFETIRAELADIITSGLDRRVTVPATDQEVRRLAETMNHALARLEGALERLRRHNLDVSHDLRTPITAIRLHLEEALMYPDEAQWSRTAAKVMEEVARLQPVLHDLADLDANRPRPTRPR
ncbi:histidine kinase dimerization/phospho-acceptor domain-containing protein [Actinomadura scrupuli]|uniref:histidine kinase dimerization/phospho-acceptor domain-containing protein n=1 Tax=Actinomadura scrupuli TaxID=559629 RepID=UPI003D97F1D0